MTLDGQDAAQLRRVTNLVRGELGDDLLGMALRIWTTLGTGEIRSKDRAADWALTRLPADHKLALTVAKAAYLDEASVSRSSTLRDARAYAALVEREIRSAAAT